VITLKDFIGDSGSVAGLSRKTGISRRQLYYWWASEGAKRQALEAMITKDDRFLILSVVRKNFSASCGGVVMSVFEDTRALEEELRSLLHKARRAGIDERHLEWRISPEVAELLSGIPDSVFSLILAESATTRCSAFAQ